VSLPGTLYVVATPIGNLGDLTERARHTLGAVDAIAAEDTRRTRALLSHLGIHRKLVFKLDAHASQSALDRCVEHLERGQDVALVTDAGTPGVSDPGAALVHRARTSGVRVTTIPGPSALTAALAISGLVEGAFLFCGFLPRKGEKRRAWLQRLTETAEPVVLFEAPGRTAATLAELAALMPERPACVARELTKVHEEAIHGSLTELAAARDAYRGEVCIVLGPWRRPAAPTTTVDVQGLIGTRLEAGTPVKAIARELAEKTGLSRREAYGLVLVAQTHGIKHS
jgi:16S rRNA (cytidine1402-2'-O)-methyltransferase